MHQLSRSIELPGVFVSATAGCCRGEGNLPPPLLHTNAYSGSLKTSRLHGSDEEIYDDGNIALGYYYDQP